MLAEATDTGQDIIDVLGGVAHDLSVADASLSLRVVVCAVVEALRDSEELIRAIDVLTEVDVVDLVNVTFVHVTSQDELSDALRSSDSEKVEDTEELGLGHMTVLGDVVVLEARLQVDALVLHSSLVLFEDLLDLRVAVSLVKVLAAGEQSVVGCYSGDTSCRGLVDTLNSESSVHVVTEGSVLEEALRVISLILLGESLELVVGQGEVKLREDRFELWASDAALAKLVKVLEEVTDSDALHDDGSFQSILNVIRVVGDVNVRLHEAVVDHIDLRSVVTEEGADLLGTDTNLLEVLWLGSLSHVGGEHVLGTVHILAEVEVVNLLGVATIAVTANNQVVHLFAGGHDVQSLEDAKELLGRDMLRV